MIRTRKSLEHVYLLYQIAHLEVILDGFTLPFNAPWVFVEVLVSPLSIDITVMMSNRLCLTTSRVDRNSCRTESISLKEEGPTADTVGIAQGAS